MHTEAAEEKAKKENYPLVFLAGSSFSIVDNLRHINVVISLTACTKAYAFFRNAYIIAAPFVGTVGEGEVYFLLPAMGIKLKYIIEKAGKLIPCAEGTLITDYFYKRGYLESFGTLFYGYS